MIGGLKQPFLSGRMRIMAGTAITLGDIITLMFLNKRIVLIGMTIRTGIQ
jgi:hypothetical protein